MTTVANTTSTTQTSTTTASRARIAQNFDTFLTLLTTQLKNQSPDSPMDTNQFTQQLVQFAQVEQQIQQNDQLGKLLAAVQGTQATAAMGYLGRKVSVDANQATPGTGGVAWTFDPPTSGSYQVRVRDKDGTQVAAFTQNFQAGAPNTFTWNGVRSDGKPLGTSAYTLELVQGGQTVPVRQSGTVTNVDMNQDGMLLTVGGRLVPASSVRSIGL